MRRNGLQLQKVWVCFPVLLCDAADESSAIIYWEVSHAHGRALHTNETVDAPSRDTNSLTSEYTGDKLSVKRCGYFQRSLLEVLREMECLQAEGISWSGISYWIHNAKEFQQ